MPRQSRKSSNTGIYHVMRRPENRPLIYPQLGREVFGYIGGCYYDMFVASGINKQLQELIRYNRTYYPIIYPLF